MKFVTCVAIRRYSSTLNLKHEIPVSNRSRKRKRLMKTTICNLAVVIVIAGFGVLGPIESRAQEDQSDSFTFKGDFRPRFEAIDEAGEEDRQRGRFRLRLGLTAKINDKVKAIVQIASGGDNPVSTNQTFDGGFSSKDIGLDLAYVDWAPNDDLHVYAGKMKNPLFRAGGHALVWDSDLNPEGIALKYEKGVFFGTLANFSVEERSSEDDSLLLAVQGGVKIDVSGGNVLTAGVSYLDYSNTKGNSPFYDGKPRGNSVDAAGNLILDYTVLEVFGAFETKVAGMPLMIFADFIRNSEADTNDAGYAFGAQLGKAKASGSWQGSLAYQDIEADALIAIFTDSDFGGGGTDATGFILKARYALADNWALAGTFFLNEVEENIGNEHDYKRLQLDVEFKF